MKGRRRVLLEEKAAIRVRAIAREIGAESGYEYGWIADAARTLGLKYTTMYAIIAETCTGVSIKTIQTICEHIGCTPSDILD